MYGATPLKPVTAGPRRFGTVLGPQGFGSNSNQQCLRPPVLSGKQFQSPASRAVDETVTKDLQRLLQEKDFQIKALQDCQADMMKRHSAFTKDLVQRNAVLVKEIQSLQAQMKLLKHENSQLSHVINQLRIEKQQCDNKLVELHKEHQDRLIVLRNEHLERREVELLTAKLRDCAKHLETYCSKRSSTPGGEEALQHPQCHPVLPRDAKQKCGDSQNPAVELKAHDQENVPQKPLMEDPSSIRTVSLREAFKAGGLVPGDVLPQITKLHRRGSSEQKTSALKSDVPECNKLDAPATEIANEALQSRRTQTENLGRPLRPRSLHVRYTEPNLNRKLRRET